MSDDAQPAADAADATAAGDDAQPTLTEPTAGTAVTGDRAAHDATTPPRSTFAGRFWVTLGFTVIVIVLLIIFIAENSQRVTVHFLGAQGSISAALALLIAAVAGALIMLLVGSVRILQLRREVKRRRTKH